MERPCAWKKYTPQQIEELEELCRGYKQFLSENKTERLCVKAGIKMAEEAGYVDLETVIAEGRELKAGDKVYAANHGKDLMLVNLGTAPLEQGFNILGAHVDSPRLDLKQNPAFEAGDMAYLDTHYYGGVKSYHWVASPLALVGVICKKDGTTVDINIGDKADDPVFTISDLLIHLSSEQMAKPAKDAVDAEILDVIVGGRPVKFDEDDKDAPKEPVKQMFLDILKEQYDVEEEDFLSAEIEVVPAGPARDMGLDRSMILGYGHDDRVCAYPSMLAQINVADVERTSITLIVDKEEIGSVGATGMTSRFFENTVAEIMTLAGEDSPLALRRALAHSRMLSSDVSAGFDPGYAGKFETKNAAFMGRGLCFNKYTGSRGKGGSNDADAEYVALVRDIMDEAGDMAYLDTHYYGGVQSYHWVASPLALVGVICKKDGTTVDINIGDKADDPVFTISDLLIHLSSEQMAKPAKDAVDAEILDVIVGGRPVKFDEDDKDAPKEPVKQMFLDILKEQYGVEEEDFLSAEIEVVPAGPARDMGLDRSMILGYGHDDRVCAYPSMLAQINVANVERTSITLIVDKEEIGSVGATGMTSRFFENTVAEIMTLAGEDSPLALRRALARSRMLSSDVSAGFDPGYAGKFETKNAAFMGRGLCFNKYTGSRGKGGSNDADAEYVALVRDIMDEAGVDFQTCELGRVNAGGGGTIAYIMAKYGMNVIDSGVAVLSMHALWEVANKADIYEAYRGYKAFIERA